MRTGCKGGHPSKYGKCNGIFLWNPFHVKRTQGSITYLCSRNSEGNQKSLTIQIIAETSRLWVKWDYKVSVKVNAKTKRCGLMICCQASNYKCEDWWFGTKKMNGEVKTNSTFKSSVYNPWTDVERQRNFCRLQKSKPHDLSQNSERSGYSGISGVTDLSKSCQNADGDTWTTGKWWAVVGADEVICRKRRKTTTIEGNKESVRSTFSSRTWSSWPGVKWRKRRWRLLMTFIPLKRPFRGPVTHHSKRCVMGETGKTIG